MKNQIYIYLFAVSLIFISCENKPDCFKGSGPLTTQEREAVTINFIELKCNATVIIHPSNISRIKVTTGANLIDKIKTKINGTSLFIENHNRCNWVRSFNPLIEVEVWTDDLTSIRIDDASGNVKFADTLHVKDFRIDSYSSIGSYSLKLDAEIATIALHNGPADFYGEGKIKTAYYYSSGYGKFDLRNTIAEQVYIRNRGTNDMYLNASNFLEAAIEGDGNIYYKGNPTIQPNITGSGKLLPLQ
jgi:hypothetical protein